MEFSHFDTRHYPTLAVRDGYAEWAATYEAVVPDELDLRLFERMSGVDWQASGAALDLACGTGRIGAWLKGKGVGCIDGIDLTPEMLAKAEARGVYSSLRLGDVCDTGLPAASYDLVVQSLADEHLADLRPLYGEAARLLEPGGAFVLVGYHPHFLMSGVPTHFDRANGQPVAVESHVHLLSEHVQAGLASGLALAGMDEGVVDDAWIVRKPKWERFRHHPVSFSFIWRKDRNR